MRKLLKASQQAIKESNLKFIFNTLLQKQPITRAGLKKITKLSATTVTVLTEELINKGFIEEKGVPETGDVGRKGILLAVKKDGAYFAGMEITGNNVKCDLYDLSFNAVYKGEINYGTQKELMQAIVSLIDKSAEIAKNRLKGAAIGVPAVIDIEKQVIVSSTVLSVKAEGGLVNILKDRYKDLYITLYNSSGFVAYAEKETRENVSNLFSIDINEGVGSGLIIGGKPYMGTCGYSGEFGHMTVDYNGEKCRCGSRGCLEGFVNINAVLYNIAKEKGLPQIYFEEAVRLIESGDQKALNVMEKTAKALSYGINNVINLVEPDAIVIGGKIKEFGIYLLQAVKGYLKDISLSDKTAVIEYSRITGNAVTLGGAYYAFRKIFQ